jgi:hypothetical protein
MHIERPSETHARESFPSRCEERHFLEELGLEYFRDPVDARLDRLLLMPFVWRSLDGARNSACPMPTQFRVEVCDKPRAVSAVMGEGKL